MGEGDSSEQPHAAAVAAARAASKDMTKWTSSAIGATARRLAGRVDQALLDAVLRAGASHPLIHSPGGIATGFLDGLVAVAEGERHAAGVTEKAARRRECPECVDGWLGDDPDRPVPCPLCRPKAAERVAHRLGRGAA